MITKGTRNSLRLVNRCFHRNFASNTSSSESRISHSSIIVSAEVRNALRNGQAVVALESTIISHGGIPYPRNLEVGRILEQTVRDGGAIPATCAVVDGIPHVGLSDSQLQAIANAPEDMPVMKASRRDLAYAMASKRTASTTVSGTMILAALVGIRVFATGGIGGVHRAADGSPSVDVSADLTELGRTPVTVVCAGVKSILHIPATLEVLETYGVPVIAYRTSIFPAFFTADSGVTVPLVAQSTDHVASMMIANDALGLQQGIVLAVSTPTPMADPVKLKTCIDEALISAVKEGVTGARITPYLLAAVTRLTGGKSLEANIQLVINNAVIATDLAIKYTALARISDNTGDDVRAKKNIVIPHASNVDRGEGGVLVIGGAAMDNISILTVHPPTMNASNPGTTLIGHGGVARNVTEKLSSLCNAVSFISIVGNDVGGQQLIDRLKSLGVNTDGVYFANEASTARYNAVHANDGELIVSVADMEIFKHFSTANVQERSQYIRNAKVVIADANFSSQTVHEIASLCRDYEVPILLEPTSDFKVGLLASCTHLIDVIKPNITELLSLLKSQSLLNFNNGEQQLILPKAFDDAMKSMVDSSKSYDASNSVSDLLVKDLSLLLWKSMRPENSTTNIGKHVITSMGKRGVMWVSNDGIALHVPAVKIRSDSINTNGAGDALIATIASHIHRYGKLDLNAIEDGVQAAADHIISKRSSNV